MMTQNSIREEVHRQALFKIKDKFRAGLVISMRVGKTRICLRDMLRQYTSISKFLVVAPTLAIWHSWKEECKIINAEFLINHITFTTYISLNKQIQDYDTVYLDECHHLLGSHNEWLKKYVASLGRIIGLTGTYPPGNTSDKAKMCNFYCPVVYRYSVDEAVNDKVINDYKIIVHMLEMTDKKVIVKTNRNGGVYRMSEVETYNYWSSKILEGEASDDRETTSRARIMRMKTMQNMPTKLVYAELLLKCQSDKTLLFVDTKEQADKMCLSYHSGNPDSKKNLESFKSGDIIKLSAVAQLSSGVTIPDLKVVIITHAYSNNQKSAQRLSRALSLSADQIAEIHILCYKNTVDEDWVHQALKQFNFNKISWVNPMFIQGIDYVL